MSIMKYDLMHKNEVCGKLVFEEDTGRIVEYHDAGNGLSPYLGYSDKKKVRKWWEMRAVPASRRMMKDIIQQAGCLNSEMYLVKNLALSMTDTYWIRPEESGITYDDVKLTNLAAYGQGKVPYHNVTSYDPNASLGGQMEKYWDLSGEKPVLVKESYRYFGQQAVNEIFATELHRRQKTDIPFVEYTASMTADRGILSMCEAFTSEKTELIPAYEVLESRKHSNEQSLYEEYIAICVEHGIERECIQKFMDYQTMTDFLISNTDEHLLNFGVLRDTDTLQLIGPAPIFDSGNSMFFSDGKQIPYTRAGILELSVTGFYKHEEKMLAKVKDRSLIKIDLLPTPTEAKEWYLDAGIPEKKAELISQNYGTKLQLFQEFQRGKTISFYKEKQAEKKKNVQRDQIYPQKFILICGSDKTGKNMADALFKEEIAKGYKAADSTALCSLEELMKNTGFILNPMKIMEMVHGVQGCENTVVRISVEDVQREVTSVVPHQQEKQMAALLAEARVKAAFLSGASVICDTDSWDRKTRETYIGMATDAGVKNCILYKAKARSGEYERNCIGASAVREPVMEYGTISERMEEEGWTEIKIYN